MMTEYIRRNQTRIVDEMIVTAAEKLTAYGMDELSKIEPCDDVKELTHLLVHNGVLVPEEFQGYDLDERHPLYNRVKPFFDKMIEEHENEK